LRIRLVFLLAGVLLLVACGSLTPHRGAHRSPASEHTAAGIPGQPARSGAGGYYQDDGPAENPPPNLEATADATPQDEPEHPYANRPYVVFGSSYTPVKGRKPYRARGIASWYGRKFHGSRTAVGEVYDMYKMTGAHPTLPLPSYVRVTNLRNGNSVVVRINDRGPFRKDRLIDLSYTAALKLGFLNQGSTEVDVERIIPGDTPVVAEAARQAETLSEAARRAEPLAEAARDAEPPARAHPGSGATLAADNGAAEAPQTGNRLVAQPQASNAEAKPNSNRSAEIPFGKDRLAYSRRGESLSSGPAAGSDTISQPATATDPGVGVLRAADSARAQHYPAGTAGLSRGGDPLGKLELATRGASAKAASGSERSPEGELSGDRLADALRAGSASGSGRPMNSANAPSPVAGPEAQVATSDAIFLQVGAFRAPGNAETLRARIAGRLDVLKHALQIIPDGGLFHVRVGPYRSRAEAGTIADQIRLALQLSPIVLVK
jgi:rare lipoprotein A